MHLRLLVFVLLVLLSMSTARTAVMAAPTWCAANRVDAVFCEDWDRYCASPPFLPDHDMDGDVDLEDFGWFQTCLSANQFVSPPTVPCHCANLDGDSDVDTADVAMFANCLTGPGIQAAPNCLNQDGAK